MAVTVHRDAAAFLAAAGPLLRASEAENNLLLSVAQGLVADPGDAADSIVSGHEAAYLATVERDGRTAGAAVLTGPHKLIVTGLPAAALDPLAASLAEHAPDLPGVVGPADTARALASRLAARLGRRVTPGLDMQVYRLTAVEAIAPPPGRLRPCTTDDRELLVAWITAFFAELPVDGPASAEQRADALLAAGRAWLWVDGAPVSMAAQVGATPHGARVALVYTPPELRGHGYGTACVAGTCQALLDGGREFCFLFADQDNPETNRLYRRVGFAPVCGFQELGLAADDAAS